MVPAAALAPPYPTPNPGPNAIPTPNPNLDPNPTLTLILPLTLPLTRYLQLHSMAPALMGSLAKTCDVLIGDCQPRTTRTASPPMEDLMTV